MLEMKETRTEHLSSYLADVFAKEDPQLSSLMSRAVADGLPDISVSPETGKLLSLLARLAGGHGGARQAVEVGTNIDPVLSNGNKASAAIWLFLKKNATNCSVITPKNQKKTCAKSMKGCC